ncbi:MAG: hypothetical protein JO018_01435 [Candidatus Eremiobacteraeota bacterium]|nr:hypothetical protein [Candidatus Eremiobacteraeota bacterium]
MRRWETVDLSIYARAFAVVARNPLIFVFPIIATILKIALGFLRGPLFDPIGGYDFGLFQLLFSLIDGFAFGLTLIAAESAWRATRFSFTSVWDEGKTKAGNILLATMGLVFVIWVASLLGGFLGPLALLVPAVALFFLIYTIPAAAIGGIPGGAALSASIQRVKQNPLAAALLVIVSLLLYFYVGIFLGAYIGTAVGFLAPYATAIIQAVVIAYLAAVTARQYDDVAFFRRY